MTTTFYVCYVIGGLVCAALSCAYRTRDKDDVTLKNQAAWAFGLALVAVAWLPVLFGAMVVAGLSPRKKA